MILVLFEVHIKPGEQETYLDLAGQLRPLLQQMDGFISIERFQSLNDPSKLLSMSVWQDEEAVKNWRAIVEHRQAQQQGRDMLFEQYTIRVVQVLREYTLTDREQAPIDSNQFIHQL